MENEIEMRLAQGQASASQKVRSRRERLVKFLTGEVDYRLSNLSSFTNNLAEAQGEELAWIQASQASSTEDIRVRLLSQILLGADDQWSGRGNDIQRCFADGFRGATKEILVSIREGIY